MHVNARLPVARWLPKRGDNYTGALLYSFYILINKCMIHVTYTVYTQTAGIMFI